jgi:hypothetical protein
MRAEQIAALMEDHPRLCIEAGQIHLPLGRFLHRALPPDVEIKTVFLMRAITARLGKKGHLFPPGDLLTLGYMFHPQQEDSPRHRLLAARALIYAKVAAKDEAVPDSGAYSRTLDDLRSIDLVNRLQIADCRTLFENVRRTGSALARKALVKHLRRI